MSRDIDRTTRGYQPTDNGPVTPPPAVKPAHIPHKDIEDRLKAIERAIEDNTAFIAKLKIHIERLTDELKAVRKLLEDT